MITVFKVSYIFKDKKFIEPLNNNKKIVKKYKLMDRKCLSNRPNIVENCFSNVWNCLKTHGTYTFVLNVGQLPLGDFNDS